MNTSSSRKCVHLTITGRVTGVGYRYWFSRRSEQLGLTGYVRNEAAGKVEAYVCGSPAQVDQIVEDAWAGPRWSKPANVTAQKAPDKGLTDFQVTF